MPRFYVPGRPSSSCPFIFSPSSPLPSPAKPPPKSKPPRSIEERFDIAIRAKPVIEDVAGLVAKTLGQSKRVLVVSPTFLDHYGRPENPTDLPKFATVASIDDIFGDGARWNLTNLDYRAQQIELKPRLVTRDLRVRLQAAMHDMGIALLPEQVVSAPLKEGLVERALPEWFGAKNILHLVYPTPRGMLPSVKESYRLFDDPCPSLARGKEHSEIARQA